MGQIFFTADYHLFHRNIIKYCNRPFSNTHRMHETIIKNHNALVNEEDTIYFLGDLTMESPSSRQRIEAILNQLNGNFIMILGNHDKFKPYTYLEMGFSSVHTSLMISHYDHHKIILCHDPAWVQPGMLNPSVSFAIVGHVHASWKHIYTTLPIINCGVDVWNFQPVTLAEIYTYKNNLVEGR